MHYSPRVLLVIGSVWPEPNATAAGSHILSLLQMFQETDWIIHYASPATKGTYEYDLTEKQIQSHKIRLNCSTFDLFIASLKPDAVLFDRFMTEEQFGWRVTQACPKAMKILDMEDLHSLRHARHQAVKENKLINNAETLTDYAKREIASIFRCDLSLVISEFELNLLKNTYQVPSYLIIYLPFLIDPPTEKQPSFNERAHFISIGNFKHPPNWDAVLQLKKMIWPHLKHILPEIELHIYGAYPPPKAMQLHNQKDKFLIKGWVSDAKEVMSQARVCLAPLRFGAGLKGKLIQAMQCGTPSVTTKVGTEGIQGPFPWAGAVEDTPLKFAEKAANLYQNRSLWSDAQKQGKQILKERFNKEALIANTLSKIEEIYHNLPTHRAKNFIGSMLQHHTLQSTLYMSRWIEEKNSKP